MAAIQKLDEANLQAICDILGATDTGLTGSKIGQYLTRSRVQFYKMNDSPLLDVPFLFRVPGTLRQLLR